MNDATLQEKYMPVSRKEAMEIGSLYYFTGKPCTKGHVADRRTCNAHCIDCDKARYPERRRSNVGAMGKERSQAAYLAKRQEWRKANPELAREARRAEYQANKDWYKKHNAKWYADNPEKAKAIANRRRSRLLSAEGSRTGDDILRIVKAQGGKCAHCRRSVGSAYHVDHVNPLALGGSNCATNLQILCPECNLSKGSKDPIEWKQQNGMLI